MGGWTIYFNQKALNTVCLSTTITTFVASQETTWKKNILNWKEKEREGSLDVLKGTWLGLHMLGFFSKREPLQTEFIYYERTQLIQGTISNQKFTDGVKTSQKWKCRVHFLKILSKEEVSQGMWNL